jgi:hypothetical protein
MPESYPINLPTAAGISRVVLSAQSVVGVTESPFSFNQQIFRHAGQRWTAQITLPPLTQDQGEEWASFLLRLRGRFGTFLLGDPSSETARGTAAQTPGTPVLDSEDGDSIGISGATPSATGYLKTGDYIQIGAGGAARLYKVLEQVNTDSNGEATLNIFPAFRKNVSTGAPIIVNNARGVFRLSSNQTDWVINTARTYGVTFAAEEAL